MKYHPDRVYDVYAVVLKEARELWDVTARQGSDEDFKLTFDIFTEVVSKNNAELIQRAKDLFETLPQKKCYSNKDILRCTAWMQAPYWVGMDVLLDEHGHSNYSRLLADPRFQYIVERECTLYQKSYIEMNTNRLIRYLSSTYQKYGKKTYTVSPGLAFALQHTELRKMPAELLALPYPCIYLAMPPKTFTIYHEETGTHDVEGAYLVEDKSVTPRAWKIMLAGSPNENSASDDDDALYHYTMILEDGKTLEECIQETVRLATDGTAVRGTVDGKDVVSGGLAQAQLEIFKSLQAQLMNVFKYAACVCLYAMHPDAEVEGFIEDPEYRALYNRAMKAKGPKRKKLFKRANEIKGDVRLRLGGSVTVSREEREAAQAPKRKGTKHSVRTYVQSHWQHYWKKNADGVKERTYKRKEAFWKGAKDLPVTVKQHHLK